MGNVGLAVNASSNVSRLSRRKKVFFAGALFFGLLLSTEVLLRVLYGPARLHYGYRFFVDTHLQEMSYPDFVGRQERIQAVRSRVGMERGRYHAVFGFTYNPSFRIDLPEDGIEIHINSHGLRGEEFPETKPSGEIRIVCIGGSTTAGEEVVEAKTYPAQLEAILREHYPGRLIRVVNAGIPSYNLRRSLLHYALNLYRFEPDFVTIYHGINDVGYYASETPEITPKANYSARALEPFVYEGDAVEGGFLTEMKWEAKNFLGILARRVHLLALVDSALTYKAPTGGSVTAPIPAGIQMFSTYYAALLRQIKATGAVPVPMTFAISYPGQFNSAERKKVEASFGIWLERPNATLEAGKGIIDAQNQAILELGREESLPVCEVDAALPKDSRHFVDVCHLTQAGNTVMAECLARTLIPQIDRLTDSTSH